MRPRDELYKKQNEKLSLKTVAYEMLMKSNHVAQRYNI